MTTAIRTQTDWTNRIHVQVDADASVLDCFTVELPPYTIGQGVLVTLKDGQTMDDLWREALTTLDHLRQQPWNPVHPASVFIPFGVITARCAADVLREHELRTLSVVGVATEDNPGHPDHMERVRALCRMADLLGMCGPLPPQQFGTFPPLRH